MKLTRINIIASLLIGTVMSCTTVDVNDRYLDYELPPIGEKTILLEEFTGWMCTNCPAGSAEATKLQTNYDHKVIVVSIHSGSMADVSSYTTKAGEAYWKAFYPDGDKTGYPAAIFVRTAIHCSQMLFICY